VGRFQFSLALTDLPVEGQAKFSNNTNNLLTPIEESCGDFGGVLELACYLKPTYCPIMTTYTIRNGQTAMPLP
jgi:hypothetical protein